MSGPTPRLAVIAKSPRPGAVKTRLTPPLSPLQAARLAEASLLDTLAAALEATAPEPPILVLEGPPGSWLPAGVELLAQRGAGLDERLANAFADVGEPLLIVGMDTPQVAAATLSAALERLRESDAVLGPAADGGYWSIGLRAPDPDAVRGVPMSVPHTCAAQRTRLADRGLRIHELELLRDFDTFEDALAVARSCPHTRFARQLAAIRTQSAAAAGRLMPPPVVASPEGERRRA